MSSLRCLECGALIQWESRAVHDCKPSPTAKATGAKSTEWWFRTIKDWRENQGTTSWLVEEIRREAEDAVAAAFLAGKAEQREKDKELISELQDKMSVALSSFTYPHYTPLERSMLQQQLATYFKDHPHLMEAP